MLWISLWKKGKIKQRANKMTQLFDTHAWTGSIKFLTALDLLLNGCPWIWITLRDPFVDQCIKLRCCVVNTCLFVNFLQIHKKEKPWIKTLRTHLKFVTYMWLSVLICYLHGRTCRKGTISSWKDASHNKTVAGVWKTSKSCHLAMQVNLTLLNSTRSMFLVVCS